MSARPAKGAGAAPDAAPAESATDALFERALAEERAGNLDAAIGLFRVLAERNLAAAQMCLGRLLAQRGALDEGRAQLERAVVTEPAFAEAHALLGNICRLKGDGEAAERSYRRALELDPTTTLAAHNLGCMLSDQGRPKEAVRVLGPVVAREPLTVNSLTALVYCYLQLGRDRDARQLLERVLRRHPDYAAAHVLSGTLIQKRDFDPEAALACFARATELGLDNADLHANRGIALQDLGRIDEAIECYERAIALEPKRDRARWQRALAQLLKGDYAAGWPDYEIRLRDERRPKAVYPYPQWQGEALEGRRLLILAEQGIGDEMMFASCFPELIAMGARCVIECAPKLKAIFDRSFPGQVIRTGPDPERDSTWARAHEPIDYHVYSGSVPRWLRQRREDFPQHGGYLRADPQKVARWRAALEQLGPGLKVGVSWRGGTLQSRAPLRSMDLDRLAPLLDIDGVQFVSLQYNATADEVMASEAAGVRVRHWQAAIDDYDETAALVCALDLTVSVCTAIVHLSGALGRPAWVMAPYCPEWRYGATGGSMPWYPSVRVFRQDSYGQWSTVLETIRAELERAIQRGSA